MNINTDFWGVFIFSILFIGTYVMAEDKTGKDSELREKLSPLEYHVTQECGTEPPFKNKYWDNHEQGIYVDIVDGKPLFLSSDKFDSGSGWPSFTKPILDKGVSYHSDSKLLEERVEVKSGSSGAHLGHVFDDGPGKNGKRYCINSASLKFVPLSEMVAQGYGEYLKLLLPTKSEVAILAGGCFWGMEDLIRELPGVLSTEVGYSGGTAPNPSYALVSSGASGHAESIRVEFDPSKLTYSALLDFFFKIHDPTTLNSQGNDRGTQYRSAIFVANDSQEEIAKDAIKRAQSSGRWTKPIVTQITKTTDFYPAEDYHQDYLQNNPGGYTCHYIRE